MRTTASFMTHQSRRRREGAIGCLLIAAASLVACAGGGGGAKNEVETLASWRATIDLAAEARMRGWVTPRYVHQLRDKARIALADASKMEKSAKLSAAAQDSVTDASRALVRSLASLDLVGP